MPNALNTLLFTCNSLACQDLVHYMKKQEDFHITAVIKNSNSPNYISLLRDLDILILDLEEESQCNDLIQLIDATYPLPHKPYTLVITAMNDNDILDRLHSAGADFIISKSKPDYSAKYIMDFLRLAHEKPKTPCRSHHDYHPRMLQIIHEELDAAGLNHCQVGYGYLAEAILLYLEKDNLYLAPALSARHQKSTLSVTRAMQNAIDCAWKKVANIDFSPMQGIAIHSSRGIPTVSDFVRHYGNIIRNM